MAEGVLGLGSGQASSLNQELIDKLKAAESKAKVDPWTEKLENWDKELEKTTEIETKITELLTNIKKFDLYNSGANAFEQMSASTTGTAAVFNAVDVSGLTPGTNNVNITQLAQRDVYQTSTFTDKTVQVNGGNDSGDKISITVAGTTYDFSTEGKSYEDLAIDINANSKLTASVEQVGDTDYRLVIKSTDSGTANALTINQTGVDLDLGGDAKRVVDMSEVAANYGGIFGHTEALSQQVSLSKLTVNGNDINFPEGEILTYQGMIDEINALSGFTATSSWNTETRELTVSVTADDGSSVTISEVGTGDGSSFKDDSHIVVAQNLKATIDGVAYDVASNTVTIQGNLTMTALEIGKSTISVQRDESQILSGLQEFITSYNELVELVDTETLSGDAVLEDTSTLKMIMSTVKDRLFGDYGASSDKNIFNYGFEIDKSGFLSINTDTFASSLNANFDDMKALFIGTAENEGLGTQLKEYIDDLDGYEGLMTQYGENLAAKKIDYEEEKEKAQESIDAKYALMAAQFAEYGAIIQQMESAFGGMKLMIQQSTAS